MTKPILSIIVPVYNVEKYLDECIGSIIQQNFKDYELILIDDGSIDKSGHICDNYAKKYNNVKVIHQQNKGAGNARNSGVKSACGTFIGFVDADDWIHKDMYWKLIKAAIDNEADIAACNFYLMNRGNDFVLFNKKPEKTIFSKREAMAELVDNKVLTFSVWNKIYKKSLFKHVVFEDNIILEDKDISYKLVNHANKVVYIPETLYYYRYNEESILRREFTLKMLDDYSVSKKMLKFYEKNYPEYFFRAYYSFFSTGTYLYQTIKNTGRYDMHDYEYLMKYDKDILTGIIKSSDLSLKKRLIILIYLISPGLYIKIREMNTHNKPTQKNGKRPT